MGKPRTLETRSLIASICAARCDGKGVKDGNGGGVGLAEGVRLSLDWPEASAPPRGGALFDPPLQATRGQEHTGDSNQHSVSRHKFPLR